MNTVKIKHNLKKYKKAVIFASIAFIGLIAVYRRNVKVINSYLSDWFFKLSVKLALPYEKVRTVEKIKIVEVMLETHESTEKVDETKTAPIEEKPAEKIIDAAAGIMNLNDILNYDYAMKNFYVVQSTTSIPREKLNLEELCGLDLTIKKDPSVPQILILHTHGEERFADSSSTGKTIVDAGTYLSEILEKEYGYGVIHVTDSFDLVNGVFDRDKAYEYSNAKIDEVLKENPSIQVVIDLHRDGVPESKRLVTKVNGKDTAKIMLFNGICHSDVSNGYKGDMNPYLKENLALTYKMYLAGKLISPDFIRCIYIADYKYTLYHVPRSMLVEAGAQNNTFEEILNAMEPLAGIIDKVLTCG